MRNYSAFRIKLIGVILFCFGLIILANLFHIQIVKNSYYTEIANNQYTGKLSSNFKRGSVFFKEKNGQLMPAATVKNGFLVAINSQKIIDAEDVYNKLSKIIEINKKDFFERSSKKDDPYEVIARRLNDEQAQKIKEMKITGVSVYPEKWRLYPAKNLASRILGFVGYKGDELAGRYGIESYYEEFLQRNGDGVEINFFAEIFSSVKKDIRGYFVSEEGDIVLTIEPNAQFFLENILDELIKKHNAKLAGGIVLNPKTGEIAAMSVKPDFDPNFYNKVEDQSLFSNPVVESVFEMGSTMKPLTMAAALNEGAVTPQTTYEDKGYLVLNSKRIENYDGKARGVVNMQEVLNQSLNTGAVFAMQKLGKEKFREYVKNYGLGEKTGIDLPEELSGLVSNLESPRDVEYATASFGHGIAVTPIEMATALSSLANGGFIVKPYIVGRVMIKNGKDIIFEPQTKRQVLSSETSETISRMLVGVVDTSLLGGTVKLEHYSIAAKTGTALMLNQNGGYLTDRFFHSFFGYFPAYDAKFLVFLFLSDPEGVRYASNSLTDPFMNIVKFLVNYYEVAPDR